MGADQRLVAAVQEGAHGFHLRLGHARFVDAWGIAQVPLWDHLPVPVEAMLAQRLIGKAAAN